MQLPRGRARSRPDLLAHHQAPGPERGPERVAAPHRGAQNGANVADALAPAGSRLLLERDAAVRPREVHVGWYLQALLLRLDSPTGGQAVQFPRRLHDRGWDGACVGPELPHREAGAAARVLRNAVPRRAPLLPDRRRPDAELPEAPGFGKGRWWCRGRVFGGPVDLLSLPAGGSGLRSSCRLPRGRPDEGLGKPPPAL